MGRCDECGTPRVVRRRNGRLRPLSGGDECTCGSTSFTIVDADELSEEA